MVGLQARVNDDPHRSQTGVTAHMGVQVVEVAPTRWQAIGEQRQALDGLGRCCGLLLAWIGACTGLGVCIVIATHHQQRTGAKLLQGLGHRCQVARIKGHDHRVPRAHVQTARCGVAFSQQHHSRGTHQPIRRATSSASRIGQRQCTQHVPKALFAATLHTWRAIAFVGAIGGFLWGDALHVPQHPVNVAHGHQQRAIGQVAHTHTGNAFEFQVRTVSAVAGTSPQIGGGLGCAGLCRLYAGLLCLCTLGTLTGQTGSSLGGGFGVGLAGGLLALGCLPAVLFGQVQQRAHRHPTAGTNAFPGVAGCFGVVHITSGLAPCVEQVKAGFVWKLALDGHGHLGPFVTGQQCRHVTQGRTQQLVGDGVVWGHWEDRSVTTFGQCSRAATQKMRPRLG